MSRSELTEALGMSRSKISLEVGSLLEAGLLVEDGLAESEGGRRSSLLRIPRSAGLIAAVDLGATSTDVALSTLGSELLAHRGESADVRAGPKPVETASGSSPAKQKVASGRPFTRNRSSSRVRVRW